jgi:protein-S-isoprenylcysteine O-methyltransferase Ste14
MNQFQANKRDDLTGEHSTGDLGQIIFCVLFLSTWIIDSFFLKYSVFLNHLIPYAIRGVFGGLLLIASGFFSINGLKVMFLEQRDQPEIISDGVFGLVRHPIYFGEMLCYFGLIFLSLSIAAGLVLVAAVSFLVFISQHEEKLLIERFGVQYIVYMEDVPMLFPKLKIRRSK